MDLEMKAQPKPPTAPTVKPSNHAETSAAMEMPRYKSHKTVWALKIKSIEQAPADQERVNPGGDWHLVPEDARYGKVMVGHDYYTKHKPAVGGYYVVYADGYKSFSPAKAFEDGNTPIDTGLIANREIDDHRVNPVNDTLCIGVLDQPGSGGANHEYMVESGDCPRMLHVKFQNGPIAEHGVNGVTHEVLLAIVADRLRGFQKGPYATKANACALTHIEEAQHWLQQRTLERMRRGVEGTHAV